MNEEQAKHRVKVGLLLDEMILKPLLKAQADEAPPVGLWFKKWDLFSEYQKKVIEFYSDNKELMNKMRNFVLEKQIVETLFANLRATEKETGFSQLDKPAEHCMTAAFPVLNMPKI